MPVPLCLLSTPIARGLTSVSGQLHVSILLPPPLGVLLCSSIWAVFLSLLVLAALCVCVLARAAYLLGLGVWPYGAGDL